MKANILIARGVSNAAKVKKFIKVRSSKNELFNQNYSASALRDR